MSTAKDAKTLSPAEATALASRIAELAAHLDAATHALLTLVREFDTGAGWNLEGALSCAHWLSWRIGLDLGAAREHVRVARALEDLPAIDDALRRGEVSYSKVRAMTRVATPRNEAALLRCARHATASQLERICRGYRQAVTAADEGTGGDVRLERWLRVRETGVGMTRIEMQLPPDEAAMLLRAIDAARERAGAGGSMSSGREASGRRDVSAETSRARRLASAPGHVAEVPAVAEPPATTGPAPTTTRPTPSGAWPSRIDALLSIAERSLSQAAAEAPDGAPPVELVVHLDAADGRAHLDDGTPVSPSTVARLACDARVRTLVGAGEAHVQPPEPGIERELGRRHRTVPASLRRTLHRRDGGCRFPGCVHRLTDAHHIRPWAAGGPTTLANLVSLCRRHHRWVHEHPEAILDHVSADGLAVVRRRDGSSLDTPAWPPIVVAPDVVARLRERHTASGLGISASTNTPRGDGERVDYGYVVEVLAARDGS